MSPSEALNVVIFVALFVAACFIASSALSLRRVLVDPPYRSRALWTAVGALGIVSILIAGYVDDIFGVPSSYAAVVIEAIPWGFAFLGIYLWIVSNVNVAMGADFFNRDVLLWKRGGRIAAPVIIFVSYVLANLPPWWVPQADAGLLYDVVTALFAVVVVYGIAALSITYFRIMDRRIKTYTRWVALSAASIVLLGILPSEFTVVFAVAWFYFMYQVVRTLAIRSRNLGAASGSVRET